MARDFREAFSGVAEALKMHVAIMERRYISEILGYRIIPVVVVHQNDL